MAPDLPRDDIKEEENLLIEAVSLLVQRQRETETWVAEQIWQAEERAASAERRYSELEARLGGIEDQLERIARELEPVRSDPVVDERLARLREQVEDLKSDTDGRPARSGPAAADATDFASPRNALRADPDASLPAHPGATRDPEAAPIGSRPALGRESDLAPPPSRAGLSGRESETAPLPTRAALDRDPSLASRLVHEREPEPAAPRREYEPTNSRREYEPAFPRREVDAGRAPVRAAAAPGRAASAASGQSVSFMELLGSTPQDRFGLLLIGVGMVAVLYALLTQLRFA